MSILKSIAVSLYNFATTETERQNDALATLSDADRAGIARGYFSKDVPLFNRQAREYIQALAIAEGLVIRHHGASSFNQMCRSAVRRNSSDSYFQMVTLGNLIRPKLEAPEGAPVGGEAGDLLAAIDEHIKEAAAERNPIKRRSILRKAISAKVKGLNTDELNFAIELVISIADEFRAQ